MGSGVLHYSISDAAIDAAFVAADAAESAEAATRAATPIWKKERRK